MNSNWKQLFEILQKQERLIIGLMSGTSLDGLDIALCSVKGSGPATKLKVLEFTTVPYAEEFKREVKSVFSRRDADLQMVCLMNEKIGLQHAALILETLKGWGRSPSEIDVIASHGQTIFHAPASLHDLKDYPNGTLQIGDGDHIAVKTGIITIADFRQKHLAAGGEGAPLAVYGDYLLFSKAGEDRIMLNIGGIANFTYLPADQDASKVFSTDVGPGNTMMDQYIQQQYPGLYYDENGAIASKGQVNGDLLTALLTNEFLDADFPKTTGPELFNLHYLSAAQQRSDTLNLRKEDVLATLCACSAKVILTAILKCFGTGATPYIYMSGGGMHNPLLVELLKSGLPNAQFRTTDDLEINPDAKEAVLFAVLANETLVGEKTNFGDREGVPSIRMGKICLPD
ncbi:anhydro-N-acetylmuramic acid kinase [Pedobacter gandavensis]|uniref:Anhydro-N-acetylmuramic acid kinase n=1 Tax=Pedobacter gandavensis TaxID=2679963 RepID=A0ABR6EYH7_9SPHI|nr:anhydro-N-acetylmuramic acid kinase [Pedobacter gandavensis]MBB2150335.1 anhydro-N-acetylmuramic acid kinase [Pedobacter gandavensis]